MLDVVCVLRSGGKVGYDVTWVERLQRAVSRNLTCSHRFSCISDQPVPCNRIEMITDRQHGAKGFWSKMQLFQPGLFTGQTLYLDLDTVVCNNLDDIVERIQNNDMVMWYEADTCVHSSAFMYWQGDHSYLWDLFCSRPWTDWRAQYCEPPLYGDQALISEHTNHQLLTDLCPAEWFAIADANVSEVNYNAELIKLLMFRKPKFKPNTMLNHPLVAAHWI